MWEEIFSVGLLKIIGVNLVLSGDNAVVIALAARSLPPKQQKQAVMIGAGAAVVLRIILTLVAAALLTLPWIKIVGAVLLLWVGVQLLMPEDDSHADIGEGTGSMYGAIRTILIADLVMSLDNVIAVAAAAGDSFALLLIGLAISIPIVIFASTFLIKLMERWPVIITIGAALIGYVAGEMLISDPAIRHWEEAAHAFSERVTGGLIEPGIACGILGAILVVALGNWFARRKLKPQEELKHAETPSA